MGSWKSEKNIDTVINGINDMGYRHGVTSNPDVYGRVFGYQLSLKNSLTDKENNWAEVLRWRGIITLLALKDYLGLDLVIEKIEIPQTGLMEIAFSYALALTPQAVMVTDDKSEDWNWRQFYVIKLRRTKNEYVDVALFSPLTIVYPVAELENKMPYWPQVRWFNRIEGKGVFKDPAVCLKKEEKIVVAYWLAELKKKLNQLTKEKKVDREMLNTIIELAESYIIDLDVKDENFEWLSTINISENNDIWNFQTGGQIGVKDVIGQTVELKIHIGNGEISSHDIFAEEICCF